jgi:putative toxin-antitoxin system antitoxin component (TIGR02293 family)
MEATTRKPVKRKNTHGRLAVSLRGVRRDANFAGTYLASPIERVEAIRRGLPASLIVQTSEAMELPREQIYTLLQFPRATVTRKIAAKAVLSPEMSERLLGLRKLIGQVEVMVRESGSPDGFNAAKWTAQWLNEPAPALGGQPPKAFMDTAEGQDIVANLIARMQSGAYA